MLDEFSETRDVQELNASENSISAKCVYAKWTQEDDSDTIKDISFDVKEGECYGICGSVGDGKVYIIKLVLAQFNHDLEILFYNK